MSEQEPSSDTILKTIRAYWPEFSKHNGPGAVAAFADMIGKRGLSESDLNAACAALVVEDKVWPSHIISELTSRLREMFNERAEAIRRKESQAPRPVVNDVPDTTVDIVMYMRDVAGGNAEPKGGWTRGEYQGAIRLADTDKNGPREPRLGDLFRVRVMNQERAEQQERDREAEKRKAWLRRRAAMQRESSVNREVSP